MTLNLDARQRDILQAMGITVWGPAPDMSDTPANADARTPSAAAKTAAAPGGPRTFNPPLATPATPQAPASHRAQATPTAQPSRTEPATASTHTAWTLHGPQLMHAAPDTAATAQLGQAWLLVLESPTPTLPADTAALLANMLQAMGLHQHPQIWLAVLAPQGTATPAHSPIPAHAMPQTLADAAQGLNASMVLLLGPGAVRAALGTNAPLGKLRGQLHAVGTCPAVVSYDPGFLLRSQATKAAAWADLCTALAHVAAQTQPPA